MLGEIVPKRDLGAVTCLPITPIHAIAGVPIGIVLLARVSGRLRLLYHVENTYRAILDQPRPRRP